MRGEKEKAFLVRCYKKKEHLNSSLCVSLNLYIYYLSNDIHTTYRSSLPALCYMHLVGGDGGGWEIAENAIPAFLLLLTINQLTSSRIAILWSYCFLITLY